jgi:hypothetical protein
MRFQARTVQLLVAGGAALIVIGAAKAEEGVWTFDNLPAKALQAKYGFATPSTSLTALRLSAARFGGASAAFVSGDGLLLTNHHVALSCVQKLSTAAEDLVREGFFARMRAAERPCPGTEIKHLDSTQDVTAAVRSAVRSTDSEGANAERNAAIAGLENACKEKTGFRCEMVTLYAAALITSIDIGCGPMFAWCSLPNREWHFSAAMRTISCIRASTSILRWRGSTKMEDQSSLRIISGGRRQALKTVTLCSRLGIPTQPIDWSRCRSSSSIAIFATR